MKYSWIKADLTFDGLRQIKYEPEYRISLSKEKPLLEKDELVIDRIGFHPGEEIYLSEKSKYYYRRSVYRKINIIKS